MLKCEMIRRLHSSVHIATNGHQRSTTLTIFTCEMEAITWPVRVI